MYHLIKQASTYTYWLMGWQTSWQTDTRMEERSACLGKQQQLNKSFLSEPLQFKYFAFKIMIFPTMG